MATTTTDIQNQGKTLEKHETIDPHPTEVPDINTSPDADAPPKEVGGGSGDDEFKVNDGDPTANNDDKNSGVPIEDDNQKKIRRAERFGVPVQRSEQEKRNSRAERFGTVSGSHVSDEIKNSEERKRKARAERFGLEQSVPAVEEEKKKARLARFAPVSKTDPVEEEKKKARALRFSEKSSSLPLANGSKGMETGKAAITGKAGGGT